MELVTACYSLPADIDTNHGVVRSSRDLPPAHYTFQIKNFSVLFEAEVEKCESGQFEVGGYKWRLVLKTNGKIKSSTKSHISIFRRLVLQTNGKKNSESHISLYLAIENQNTLSLGWEVNVTFRFFVFDQIRNKYLCIQDGIARRFHNLKTEWGFAQLLSYDTLNDPSNGYIVDDSCILGAEVFVLKRSATGMGVCLSMLKLPESNYFTWRFGKVDARRDQFYVSNVFVVEGRKWKLLLYPRGNMTKTGTEGFLSLYLQPADDSGMPNRKLYAKYKLRIKDQVNSNHLEKTFEYWFDSSYFGFGPSHTFSSLRDLKDPSNGYLVDDALVVECKIDVISEVIKDFSG